MNVRSNPRHQVVRVCPKLTSGVDMSSLDGIRSATQSWTQTTEGQEQIAAAVQVLALLVLFCFNGGQEGVGGAQDNRGSTHSKKPASS